MKEPWIGLELNLFGDSKLIFLGDAFARQMLKIFATLPQDFSVVWMLIWIKFHWLDFYFFSFQYKISVCSKTFK